MPLTIEGRLLDLANNGSWDDPRALLARVELYALQGLPPSGGLRADIEMYLAKVDPDFDAALRATEASRTAVSSEGDTDAR
jgi:hypothetical protein